MCGRCVQSDPSRDRRGHIAVLHSTSRRAGPVYIGTDSEASTRRATCRRRRCAVETSQIVREPRPTADALGAMRCCRVAASIAATVHESGPTDVDGSAITPRRCTPGPPWAPSTVACAGKPSVAPPCQQVRVRPARRLPPCRLPPPACRSSRRWHPSERCASGGQRSRRALRCRGTALRRTIRPR